jgi:acyl-CoA synthetase (AMP-forming)/AMP-acid ligase II
VGSRGREGVGGGRRRSEARALHSLPLYHSAQMHVFLMPDLLAGATNVRVGSDDPEQCCELIEREEINSVTNPAPEAAKDAVVRGVDRVEGVL